jgi:hypothetical protein
MRYAIMALWIAAILALTTSTAHAQAQAGISNFSGNYRCEPQPQSCRSGQSFSVTQSGNVLQFKSDKGEQGEARLTSDTTLTAGPPWNMFGVVYDGAIEWSNGTRWRKQ